MHEKPEYMHISVWSDLARALKFIQYYSLKINFMIHVNKFYSPDPGNRNNESGKKEELRTDEEKLEETTDRDSEDSSGKSKIEQALQDWSNDDARDRAIDDSSPLRSGL